MDYREYKELKMVQKVNREELQAIKEDLAKWLSGLQLLDNPITAHTFMDDLKSAVPLCRLAKLIQQAAAKTSPMAPRVPQKKIRFKLPATNIFHAVDNAAIFIRWCKNVKGVHTFFESEGLVKQKDERGVILCIRDLRKVAAEVGLEPPELIRKEIIETDGIKEAAEEQKSDPSSHALDEKGIESPELVKVEREINIMDSDIDDKKAIGEPESDASSHDLDEKVLQLLNQCTCQPKLQAISYGGGQFQITTKLLYRKTIYTRAKLCTVEKNLHQLLLALKETVMVRVGGGWENLDHFLLKHDPCRHRFKDINDQ